MAIDTHKFLVNLPKLLVKLMLLNSYLMVHQYVAQFLAVLGQKEVGYEDWC
jgi:hypothetical protein